MKVTIADPTNAARAYVLALDGVKSAALRKAVQNLLRGEVEDMSRTFMPAAPELAQLCRRLEREALAVADIVERLAALPEESAEPEFSDEHCAAMRARIRALIPTMDLSA